MGYLLDGLEAWLELERELGVRSVECDRSLLDLAAEPPPPPAAAPETAGNAGNAGKSGESGISGEPGKSGISGKSGKPGKSGAALFDFAFLHDRPLSPKGVEMMSKIIVAMGKSADSAPIVFEGPLPRAKIYVVLGANALKKWMPGVKAGPGDWITARSGEDALVTYSPEKIVRYAVVTDAVRKMKQDMWKSLKSVMQRVRG